MAASWTHETFPLPHQPVGAGPRRSPSTSWPLMAPVTEDPILTVSGAAVAPCGALTRLFSFTWSKICTSMKGAGLSGPALLYTILLLSGMRVLLMDKRGRWTEWKSMEWKSVEGSNLLLMHFHYSMDTLCSRKSFPHASNLHSFQSQRYALLKAWCWDERGSRKGSGLNGIFKLHRLTYRECNLEDVWVMYLETCSLCPLV